MWEFNLIYCNIFFLKQKLPDQILRKVFIFWKCLMCYYGQAEMTILSHAFIMDETLILDFFLSDGNTWYHIPDRFNITQLRWDLHMITWISIAKSVCITEKLVLFLPHSVYKQHRLFLGLPWPQECIIASVQIGFLTLGRFWVKAHSI